ncbi:MAG: 3'-5' exonuclease [Bacteroidetes bacterium]|nr:3'-5' exonuclease [Bacteroidota bacterium]
MLEQINIENILFIDIETVPAFPAYADLPDVWKKLWDNKSSFIRKKEEDTPETLYERAGIYSEFGKVICISAGFIYVKEGSSARNTDREIRVKSFSGDDERTVLSEFAELITRNYHREHHRLCAHNGKEFDYPYLSRRMLINSIKLPKMLDTAGKKPWEIQHIDTFELWKFGDSKNYTSLELLSNLFNIPTSKDDITGKDIARVYWQEKNLPRIVTYCRKDVISLMQLFLCFRGEPIIAEEKIAVVE